MTGKPASCPPSLSVAAVTTTLRPSTAALITTMLAGAYVVSGAGWIPPIAAIALLATVASWLVSIVRIRAESRERRDVERSLR